MRGSIWIVFSLLCGQDAVRSIRIQELRVPAHAAAGGEALLGCQFDLENDLLYSVKWYKDDKEIFRYLPNNNPDRMWFKGKGVTVDLSRSSSDVVTLTNIRPESAGVYRCEVTGEAPLFAYATDDKYVTVQVLPKSNPNITGLKYVYDYGDYVSANCSSGRSSPEAIVNWLVNNKPVHRTHLRGPWRSFQNNDSNSTVAVTLGLRFMVLPSHYKNGIMEIKCQATIAPLYQKEVLFIFNSPESEFEAETDPIDDSVEPSPQSLIPSLQPKENNPPPDDEDSGMGEQEISQLNDNLETPEVAPVATDAPVIPKGSAKKSLDTVVVLLLIPVMLL